LFFNFAVSFNFGFFSLAQEMSFVDCYLLYFNQWLITRLLLALLPFQSLFTESFHGDQLLATPTFSGVLTAPHPLCCMFFSVPCLLFSFLWSERSVCPGGYTGLSQGWLWEYHVMLVAHLC
jgi:hypothetical protein